MALPFKNDQDIPFATQIKKNLVFQGKSIQWSLISGPKKYKTRARSRLLCAFFLKANTIV